MQFLCFALQLYLLVLLVRIVMSWIPMSPGSIWESIYGFFFSVTEPVLRPFRNLLPPVQLGSAALDLSPLLVFVGLQVLIAFVC